MAIDNLATSTEIADLAEYFSIARRLVALTGAGVSTESGIPDFRSPDGLWTQHPPATYREFMESAEKRRAYWQLRQSLAPRVATAQPNAAHYALAELERRGILTAIITQNFDGLHQAAGNAPERIIELHGTSREAACQSCGSRLPMADVQARVAAGDDDPRCACGGYLKAATILFGQRVPQEQLGAAIELARTCDAMLVVGSSLRVHPAARLPLMALASGAPLLIVNREPTPLDDHADLVIQATAGPTLACSVALLRP